MRALLCGAAVLLAGCRPLMLSPTTGVLLSFDGAVSHHANAAHPRSYVGLRLSLIRRPR